MWGTDILELDGNHKNSEINLKHRKIIIILHGEEIYIENIIIPKVKYKNIYSVVEKNLRKKFKNIDDIMFSYNVLEDNKLSLNITIFCMNWNNTYLFKKFIENKIQVKGIIPVQLYALNKYNKNIQKTEYIFAAFFKDTAYMIAYYDRRIIFNDMFNIKSKEDILYSIEEFKLKLNILVPDIEFKNIEFLNLPYKELIEKLNKYYNCNDLGELII